MIAVVRTGDVTLHVPSTREFTLGEWRWIKVTLGTSMFEFEAAVEDADPEAWWALLAIAAKRDSVDVAILDDLNMYDVITSIRSQADAADGEGEEGNASSGDASDGESVRTDGPSPETSPAPSGTQSSPTSSVSTPG